VFSRAAFNGIDTRQRRIPASAKLTYPSFDHQDAKLVGKVVGADPSHPEGLLCDVKISKIPAGDETLQLADDRALSPSVGFLARGGDHTLNRSSMTRRINRAFLDHLSFVPQPAYDGARIVAVRADSAAGMRELAPVKTPLLDEILNDPVFKWADERLGN
jgi:phage head maturation protease